MAKETTKKERIVDSVESLNARMAEVREAQRKFALYTQEQVDRIFLAAVRPPTRLASPSRKPQSRRPEWASWRTR